MFNPLKYLCKSLIRSSVATAAEAFLDGAEEDAATDPTKSLNEIIEGVEKLEKKRKKREKMKSARNALI